MVKKALSFDASEIHHTERKRRLNSACVEPSP